MNPNPLFVLNHLTFPLTFEACVPTFIPLSVCASTESGGGGPREERRTGTRKAWGQRCVALPPVRDEKARGVSQSGKASRMRRRAVGRRAPPRRSSPHRA